MRSKKIIGRPARQDILPVDFQRPQLLVIQRGQPLMQICHDVEIGHQRTQFGGGTEVELGAFVDIQRLVEIIGLHPQGIGVASVLIQREAVHHLGRIATVQQLLG